MKKMLAISCCVFSLAFAGSASAATLTWDRNSEEDMQDYQIYACFTPGCIVTQSATTLQGTVVQTASGVKPSATFDTTGKEGSVAISARDTATPPNESGLSVPANFDKVAPLTPAHLILQ